MSKGLAHDKNDKTCCGGQSEWKSRISRHQLEGAYRWLSARTSVLNLILVGIVAVTNR